MMDGYLEKRYLYLNNALESNDIELDFDKDMIEKLKYVGALVVRNELGEHDELVYLNNIIKGGTIDESLGKAYVNHILNDSVKCLIENECLPD